MIEQCADLDQCARQAAKLAVQRCARTLLTVDLVAAHVIEEWKTQAQEGEQGKKAEQAEQPSQELLNRMALRYCSRSLYFSCCSSDPNERNAAFDSLYSYLKETLESSKFARSLTEYANALDDVLQQTLTELYNSFSKQPPGGPDDPAAFLKWTQVVVLHNASAFLRRAQKENSISLEAQSEEFVEQNAIGERQNSIEEHILHEELQETLKHVILSLKNPRYREVLLSLFLAGMEEGELAASLGVQVKDIYLWRHRALQALRSNREVIEALSERLR